MTSLPITITDPELATHIADEADHVEAVTLDAADLKAFKGQRVRLTIVGRKMTVPGKVKIDKGNPHLVTNWGLDLNLADPKNRVTLVETVSPDNGRFVPTLGELQAA